MTNKTAMGEIMSAPIRGTARRRISLLAGSSLVAVGLTVIGGVALAPSQAHAQATCVATPTPTGNGTNTVTIAAGTYNPGITCAYTGTAATVSTLGGITVSSTAGGNGVNLSATGTSAINWDSTLGTVVAGAQTNGPVIDAVSASGPINITTAGVTGTQVSVTHGIRAISSGGGAVTVNNTVGNVNINSNTGTAQQQAAIQAVSTGGNGAVSVTTTGNVTGRLRGIQAQASGSGALTIVAKGGVTVNSSTTIGVVSAIDATTGTGLLNIDVVAGTTAINGQFANAIRTNAGGVAQISIGEGRSVASAGASPETMNVTSVGVTTINNAGTIGGGIAIRAAGGGIVINNDRIINGRVDFSAVTGEARFNNTGDWNVSGASVFAPGGDSLANVGTMTVSGGSITNLDSLENSGSILFGFDRQGSATYQTLSIPGTSYEGVSGGRLFMEASLGSVSQTSCSTVTAADCFSLVGGETSGVTSIVLTAASIANVMTTDGIVLVEVTDGESHEGDFVLNVNSTNYGFDPVYGGVIHSPGMLAYTLQYDEDTQTHRMVSVVPTNRFEYLAGVQEVLSVWHTTSSVVMDRQADLRRGSSRGFWARGAIEHTDRDLTMPFTTAGGDLVYEDSYAMDTATGILGYDLLADESGDRGYVLGVHGGVVRSEMERTFSPTTDTLDGAVAGLYGGLWVGALTLDATLNVNFLKLTHERPASEISDTNVILAGGRAEAGWKMPLSEGFYIQPLGTLAFVNADIKEVFQGTFSATYEEVRSLRAAVGLRAGAEMGAVDFWALGRVWNEFLDKTGVTIATDAESVTFVDDLSGQFSELGAGASLASEDGLLEGFLSAGAKFHDAYDNYSASAGFRLRW